jgi:hypothetical protein
LRIPRIQIGDRRPTGTAHIPGHGTQPIRLGL